MKKEHHQCVTCSKEYKLVNLPEVKSSEVATLYCNKYFRYPKIFSKHLYTVSYQ
jgi:hypothetical protein